MKTAMDLDEAIIDRIASGIAADLAEIRRFDHAWGRAFSSKAGDQAAEVLEEVRRRPDIGSVA
jgi:hypothetical protein